MLRFGTAGIPLSTPRPGTEHGVRRAHELGLECMELAWGNGVRMSDAAADRIAAARRECGLELTVHAPYYVNLAGSAEIVERSHVRLVTTGRQGARCGAKSFCFHAGFMQGRLPALAAEGVEARLGAVVAELRREGVTIDVRPELTGKPSQLGSFEEILGWSVAVDGIHPCIDFSHQYARHQGRFNRYEEFAAMLDQLKKTLGRAALQRMHVHISGIEFGPKGERRHLPLKESKFRYRELLRALKDANASGWVVAETPAMEEDALRLQRCYRRMR
jgi:deoxyribonuclease IV